MATDAPFGPTEANAKASVPQVPAPPVIGLPYMSTSELALLRQLVAGLQAYSEFGIGGSTRLAIESGIQRVVSVESDKAWLDAAATNPLLAAAVADGRLSLLHGDVGPTRAWGAPSDPQTKHLWPGYWQRPWAIWSEERRMPDLVFVDGRFRVACALAALDFARSFGAAPEQYRVVIHDFSSKREYYNPVLQFFDVVDRAESLVVLKAHAAIAASALCEALSQFSLDTR
ncbi:hypothetical protein [Falsiroseomonas sp.]|uniref:hypothetical protein n=1 Tax=Falsiroseomonas sp. TaxID=2870721 RepID=UPI0034A4BC4C